MNRSGRCAFPIVLSGVLASVSLFAADAPKDSAATRLGKGRAVEFGHNGYFGRATLDKDGTGRLFLNAVQWAGTAGEKKGPRVGVRRAETEAPKPPAR